MVLGSIAYSSNQGGISSLPSDFYDDIEGHIDEIKEYDILYMIKANFN